MGETFSQKMGDENRPGYRLNKRILAEQSGKFHPCYFSKFLGFMHVITEYLSKLWNSNPKDFGDNQVIAFTVRKMFR